MELTLNENLSTQSLENEDEGFVTVDPDTRKLIFPNENFFLGVSGDQDSRLIHFKFVDNVTDAIKLSEQEIQVNYLNANQEKGYDVALNKNAKDGYCYFDWKPSSKVFLYAGDVNFLVCVRSKNEVSGFKKTDWNTVRSTHTVPEGIEPDETHVDEQTDETITNLLLKINEAVTASANSEKAAKTSATSSKNSADASAVSAAKAKASETAAAKSLSDFNNNTNDIYQKLAAFDSLGLYVDEGGYLCQK